jgi:hypothetical protein
MTSEPVETSLFQIAEKPRGLTQVGTCQVRANRTGDREVSCCNKFAESELDFREFFVGRPSRNVLIDVPMRERYAYLNVTERFSHLSDRGSCGEVHTVRRSRPF